ncbi:MAG: helix-turn-helix type-3-like protein [Lachnospiraceae bacterium]|jgi:transcriptional regulator with XRE-family HTH domain|nr:helix-turn-helix type-3-like protein [Lachnospiraceae bacterium]
MSVSERIQKRREKLGVSQTELAKRAGLQPPAISQYESGLRSPSYEALIKLSNALNVTTDYLISGKEASADIINDQTINLLIKIAQGLSVQDKDKLLEYAVFLSGNYYRNIPIPIESDFAEWVLRNHSDGTLPIDVRQIADKLNILIYEGEMDEEGEGILFNGSQKIIVLNSKIKNSQRKKFTTAILIGHAVIPWHLKQKYHVRKSGSSTLLTEDIHEMEAQDFASKLIMPQVHLNRDFVKTKASIESLKQLALEKYDVSLFALVNSLVEYAKDKYAVIQSEKWNIIKTYPGNRPLNPTIDPLSITATFFDNPSNTEEVRQGDVPAKCWLLDAQDDEVIHEECIYNPEYKKVLTLLIKN